MSIECQWMIYIRWAIKERRNLHARPLLYPVEYGGKEHSVV